MADFLGPVKTPQGYDTYINANLVTDFAYDPGSNETIVNIVGEPDSRKYPGDLTGVFVHIFEAVQALYPYDDPERMGLRAVHNVYTKEYVCGATGLPCCECCPVCQNRKEIHEDDN